MEQEIGLHTLRPPKGAKKNRKRIGRGPGSGSGTTAGRGTKGQKARAGYSKKAYFEGGQMPLVRRVAKRGFNNIFRIEFATVNVRDLSRFDSGTEITPELLRSSGLVRKKHAPVKILAEGDVPGKFTVKAHKFSAAAAKKIQEAGGDVEVLPMPGKPS